MAMQECDKVLSGIIVQVFIQIRQNLLEEQR